MSSLPLSQTVIHDHDAPDCVTLGYDDRFLRRKVLTSDTGLRFLVDLAQTTSVGGGDAFVLGDGRRIGVKPAPEALLEVTGDNLLGIVWHIGNRHTPCQIEPHRVLIQRNHVMQDMLEKLGAQVRCVTEAFTPVGGAYGHGRTHGHAH